MTSSSDRRPTIVVGVDGSPSSVQALGWAVRQAELTGGEVHAVNVWHLPTTDGWETVLDAIDWAASARSDLQRAVEALEPDQARLVHQQVREGRAARVLTELSAHADLVVVGSRGRGHFHGRLMGSVGLHVLAHASCPVVVVHGDRLPGPAPRPSAAAGAGSLTTT